MFLNIPQGAAGVRGVPGLFLHPPGPASSLLSERSRHLREVQGESGGEEYQQWTVSTGQISDDAVMQHSDGVMITDEYSGLSNLPCDDDPLCEPGGRHHHPEDPAPLRLQV